MTTEKEDKMAVEKTDKAELQKRLCKRVCDVILFEFPELDHVDVSVAMVSLSYAFRDWNGGLEDSRYAADCLREIIDEILAKKERLVVAYK